MTFQLPFQPTSRRIAVAAFAVLTALPALTGAPASAQDGMKEANTLQTTAARESGRPAYSPATAVNFKKEDNVFVKSALEVNFTYRAAFVTLPLFRGLSPKNEPVYYIITDASDFDVARKMGLNYAPKLRHAVGDGAQRVTLDDGVMRFRGNVDFTPEHLVIPGSMTMPFPPKTAKAGAVGDAEWSSMVVLPSGVVLNVQMVNNASGTHDRVKSIDLQKRTVTLSLLDGFQGGKQYYYHLVTDVSEELPAALENGVHTPRLAKVLGYGQSRPSDRSALLGFSPVLNGITDTKTHQDQGFAASIANAGIDPINVFPIDPDNDNRSQSNNYSPLWDAHVNMWTEKAVKDGKMRRITSFGDLEGLVRDGLIASASINPPGPGNSYVAGLRPTRAIINCPVIAQPNLPPQ
ncbi:hypothetical protein [Coleofasciculus sp. H7-2]|uniref:hypothetical protein n=1 Tax=Coleofasciculus sp. H7-2 TaxID=3351545 RepID=UPI00366F7550